jgi:hypothetical protein
MITNIYYQSKKYNPPAPETWVYINTDIGALNVQVVSV